MLNSTDHVISVAHRKLIRHSDVVSISEVFVLLINVKMPTIVDILTFMSILKFMSVEISMIFYNLMARYASKNYMRASA